MDAKKWIMDWFIKKTGMPKENIQSVWNENYFDNGLIDSFVFIELLEDIENAGFALTNDQFEDRRFATISGLVSILENSKK